MRSKLLLVIVALVLGGIAAVMAAGYLRSARTDIASENKPVEVLVAKQDLPRGLSSQQLIDEGLVSVERVPAQFVAADAVSSQRVVSDMVLSTPVSAGEQLTRSRFEYPADAGLSYTVPEGYVGLSVEVDEVTGVGGLLKPGDNVVVFASFQPSGAESAVTKAEVVRAQVLAVGAVTSAESGSGAADDTKSGGVLASSRDQGSSGQAGADGEYRNVTLALKIGDAGDVSFAEQFGTIQLGLLPKNAEEPSAPAPITYRRIVPNSLLKGAGR